MGTACTPVPLLPHPEFGTYAVTGTVPPDTGAVTRMPIELPGLQEPKTVAVLVTWIWEQLPLEKVVPPDDIPLTETK